MEASAGVICSVCHWFGVYRSDVALRLAGCPNCGGDTLEVRDLEDESWRAVARELLEH